ncbi:MAG: hypothetical protein AAFN70_18315 [Planctomycetota bacterium]
MKFSSVFAAACLAAFLVILGTAGCNNLAGPPIAVSVRNSMLGESFGKVLIITNQSDQYLHQVTVCIDGGAPITVHDSLEPHQTRSVGWLELMDYRLQP